VKKVFNEKYPDKENKNAESSTFTKNEEITNDELSEQRMFQWKIIREENFPAKNYSGENDFGIESCKFTKKLSAALPESGDNFNRHFSERQMWEEWSRKKEKKSNEEFSDEKKFDDDKIQRKNFLTKNTLAKIFPFSRTKPNEKASGIAYFVEKFSGKEYSDEESFNK
jgi:hypothetical protein